MASPPANPLKRFIGEIHRRSLWQVLGIYAVASWAVLSVVDTLGGALNLPDWFPAFALALLLIGLPVVLATAFVQEGASARADDEVEADASDSSARAPSNLAAGTGSLDRPTTRPPRIQRMLTWRNSLTGGILAFALLGFVGTGWVLFGGGLRPTSIEQSIAVLPFDDLSPEGDQQYFVEGLSEEIINALTQIPDLKVAARTSTFLLAEEGTDIATVASTLGVANVLEGSVRKSGDQLRITAQLIEAQSGFHLWSETFDRELTDIFDIQDAIARAIAERLQVTVVAGDQTRLAQQGTEILEAYELTLQGRFHANQLSQEALEQAIDYFDDAINRDPRYAPAYAGKAFAYANLAALEYLPPLIVMPEAKAAARRAIELDNSLAEAHTWLGYAYLFFDWDWTAAEEELLTALALNPNSAEAHLAYAAYFTSRGQMDEAVSQVRQAQEIDPKSIMVYAGGFGSQWTFLLARRYAESVEEGRRAVDLAPENSFAHGHLGLALVQNGVFGEGIAELEEATRLEDAPLLKAFLAYGYAVAGRESDARALLSEVEEISRQRYTCAYEIAVAHLSLGDEDAAFEWMEKALEDRAACIPILSVDPRLDLLRDDPRYQVLLQQAGITW